MNQANRTFLAPAPFSLADLFSFLWQKKIRITLTAIILIVVGGYYFVNLPKIYRATSTLLLEENNSNFTLQNNGTTFAAAADDKMDTHMQFIRSLQFSRKVVDDLNLSFEQSFRNPDTSYSEEQQTLYALDVLQRNLRLSKVGGTKMLKVSFDSPSPEIAQMVANHIGPAFFSFQDTKNLERTDEASSWLNRQLSGIQNRLIDAENALQLFLNENRIVDINSQLELIRLEISTVKQEKINSHKALLEIQSAHEQAIAANGDREALAKVSWIAQQRQFVDIRNQLLQEQKDFAQVTQRYKEKHHKYIAAQAKLRKTETKYSDILDETAASLEKAFDVAKSRDEFLQQQAEQADERHRALGQHELQLEKLRRDVESTQKLYDVFLERLQETEILRDVGNTDNFEIVDYATTPNVPAKPRLVLLFSVLIALSGIFSVGFWLLLYLVSDKKTRHTELLRKLSIPVLAEVPRIPKEKKHRKLLSKRRIERAKLLHSEAIRTLRAAVMLSTQGREGSVIAITEINSNSATVEIAKELAGSFSRLDKTLLIDTNFRTPVLGEQFGITSDHPGFCNFILKESKFSACIEPVRNTSLSVMPAGRLEHDPLVYISKPRFGSILKQLGIFFGRLIVNTPPIDQYSDALVTAKNVDGMIVLCDAEAIESNELLDQVQHIVDSNAPLLGVVFCNVKNLHR